MADEEPVVPAKKGKTRRGFSKKVSITAETGPALQSSGVYTTRVSKCFDALKNHEFDEELRKAAIQNEDVEDDILTTCPTSHIPDLPGSAIAISDEEDNSQNVQNSTFTDIPADILSPLPPPSPPGNKNAKKKRGTKGKKKLLSAANDLTQQVKEMKSHLSATSTLLTSPDPEVYLVDANDELTVRVELMGRVQRFVIPADEPFSTIMSTIACQENVQNSCVMMVLNDRTLTPTETPHSVNLHMADIVRCHIVKNDGDTLNDSISQDSCSESTIEIVVQCRTSRRPEHINAQPDMPLSNVMKEYAQRVKKDQSLLQFMFDGEKVTPGQTPSDLDMEDGDILDVKEQEMILIT